CSFRRNGEVGRVVSDVVIAEHTRRTQRSTDRIGTAPNRLTGRATVGRRYTVPSQESRERSTERRIWIAISLARPIRRHRCSFRRNGEVGRVVSDVVIAEHTRRTQRSTDRIGTAPNRLTGRATVGRRYTVPSQESRERSTERRIWIAISLARPIRRHRCSFRRNGEVGRVVSDVVIAEHTRRTQRSTDRIGTAPNRLTGRATVGRRYTVPSQES